jgi:putative hydrolase of the HAD superfamily
LTIRAVTFDAGQTLVELDTEMLAARCAERGLSVAAAALDAALPGAWREHERAVAAGARHPWKELMAAVLRGARADAAAVPAVVDWLFEQQPTRNLFRRAIAGMRELVEDLHRRGVPMAVVSNSEGRLEELLDELGWSRWFVAIADSGRLGIVKPDPAIFRWAIQRLGVPAAEVCHVGDSRGADVDGALAAGMRAIWFGPAAHDLADPRVAACADATALRARLDAWIRR